MLDGFWRISYVESDPALWTAYRATVQRFPDLDGLRWRDAEGWHRATWRALCEARDGDDDVDAVFRYFRALEDDAPAETSSSGVFSQRAAFDHAKRFGAEFGVGPRDRVLGLGPTGSRPWLRALWVGLVHGCAIHLGARAVMSEVNPTIVIDEKVGN